MQNGMLAVGCLFGQPFRQAGQVAASILFRAILPSHDVRVGTSGLGLDLLITHVRSILAKGAAGDLPIAVRL